MTSSYPKLPCISVSSRLNNINYSVLETIGNWVMHKQIPLKQVIYKRHFKWGLGFSWDKLQKQMDFFFGRCIKTMSCVGLTSWIKLWLYLIGRDHPKLAARIRLALRDMPNLHNHENLFDLMAQKMLFDNSEQLHVISQRERSSNQDWERGSRSAMRHQFVVKYHRKYVNDHTYKRNMPQCQVWQIILTGSAILCQIW